MSPKSAATVLRSIVSPAIGLSVAALVTAGAASGCSETTPTKDSASAAVPVGTASNLMEAPGKRAAPEPTVTAGDSAAPPASASAIASASSSAAPSSTAKTDPIPKPGDIAPPGMRPPPPGTRPLPYPGPPATKVGVVSAPGFAPSGFVTPTSDVRPTRGHRRVTDADRGAMRGRRSLV